MLVGAGYPPQDPVRVQPRAPCNPLQTLLTTVCNLAVRVELALQVKQPCPQALSVRQPMHVCRLHLAQHHLQALMQLCQWPRPIPCAVEFEWRAGVGQGGLVRVGMASYQLLLQLQIPVLCTPGHLGARMNP